MLYNTICACGACVRLHSESMCFQKQYSSGDYEFKLYLHLFSKQWTCCEWSDPRIDPSVTIILLLVTTQVLGPASLTLFGNYHEMHAYCPNRAKPAPAYIMNSHVKHNPRYMDSQVPIYLPAAWHELQLAYVFQSRLGSSDLHFDPTRHTWAPPQHLNRRGHAWRAG